MTGLKLFVERNLEMLYASGQLRELQAECFHTVDTQILEYFVDCSEKYHLDSGKQVWLISSSDLSSCPNTFSRDINLPMTQEVRMRFTIMPTLVRETLTR